MVKEIVEKFPTYTKVGLQDLSQSYNSMYPTIFSKLCNMKKFLITVFNLLSSLVISCVNQLETTVFSFLFSTENYTYKRQYLQIDYQQEFQRYLDQCVAKLPLRLNIHIALNQYQVAPWPRTHTE